MDISTNGMQSALEMGFSRSSATPPPTVDTAQKPEALVQNIQIKEQQAIEQQPTDVPAMQINALNGIEISTNSAQLRFQVDSTSGRSVMTVVNKDTQEVVRQIPSEQALKLAQSITEYLAQKGTDSTTGSLPVGTLMNEVV